MRLLQPLALVFLVSAFVFGVQATSSAITDMRNGEATNVVESNNVVHVYNYLGTSSEAVFTSTFDEGETWIALPAIPLRAVPSRASRVPTKTPNYARYSRSNRSSAVPV